MAEDLILNETLRGGGMWSWTLKRGTALRLTATEAGANVSALFLNADAPLERYNMPDTLKAQFIAFLTKGNVLYSDMGRVLCSIIDDTCGWHDTLCGATDARLTETKYGTTDYQQQRNDMYRNGRDNFLVELGKYGLGRRDLPVPVNFFSKVMVDDDGNLKFQAGNARAGAAVELRAEMNVLVVLSNTPHPMDPSGRYAPPPVRMQVQRVPAPGADDPCRRFRAENARGFINTEILFR
ncbi:MAG: urea carboxylase-associated family protein [Fibrobacteres bacterium]|nr:urea carboxylase-associated family protein [Fibrobacterota bacterium]